MTSQSSAGGSGQIFTNGLVRDTQARVDLSLRALEANRLDDAHRILILLERDLASQIQWEQDA